MNATRIRRARTSRLAVGLSLFGGLVFLSWLAWGPWRGDKPALSIAATSSLPRREGMIRLPKTRFLMGSNEGAADTTPAHEVTVSAFWIDEHEVTNAQFEQFVEETGYRTSAELRGASRVLQSKAKKWRNVAGADWRHPTGPDSLTLGRDALPVVHVSWRDAAAYAQWAGKRLPTEAEFECAQRGGTLDSRYSWGDRSSVGGKPMANLWQGRFPYRDSGDDGYTQPAPIASFPSNRYELFDVAGNVREWCADWYADDAYQRSAPNDPQGPRSGRERVLRGGSWLSSEEANPAYVWARERAAPDFSDNQTGFRCVRRVGGGGE